MIAAEIQSIPGVRATFQAPIPHNFVHLLVPRSQDPASYMQRIGAQTRWLNHADQALLDVFARWFDGASDATGQEIVEQWRACIRDRTNLRGTFWLLQAARRVEAASFLTRSIAAELRRNHPAVLETFRQIPDAQLRITRVNAYLEPAQMRSAIEAVTDWSQQRDHEGILERIEVAQLGTTPRLHQSPFPTVIAVLRHAFVQRSSTDEVRRAVWAISSRLSALGPCGPTRPQYAMAVSPSCTLTQGYVLFKQYLRVVGLLDEFYDPRHGHALGHELADLAVVEPSHAARSA